MKTGNMLTKIIIVNLIVSVVFIIVKAFLQYNPAAQNSFVQFFAIPGDPIKLLFKPWTIFTHMFVHTGFFHLIFNMLFLYWFGRIVGDLLGDRRILPLYLLGGLAGAISYVLAHILFPEIVGPYALGASAAVLAILATAGATAPDYIMRFIIIGDVKLKFVVLVAIIIDIMGIANMDNTGGHIAHMGGALFGMLFVRQLREGVDMTEPVNNLITKVKDLFSGNSTPKKKKSPLKVRHKSVRKSGKGQQKSDVSHQEKLDNILDIIKEKGYESLTDEEKEFLFQASKK